MGDCIDSRINIDTADTSTYVRIMVNSGLDGVIAAQTSLSRVDGERGELIIGGFRVEELAAQATFEETTWLLWNGALPTASELEAFRTALAAERALDPSVIDVLHACARKQIEPMDALRI